MQGEYLLYAEKEILERVDEYALYCHYLNYTILIGGTYSSPIRESKNANDDIKPSFGIYERKYGIGHHEFMWKDGALGLHGDIFDLVSILFKYQSRKKAMFKIMADFGIGGDPDGEVVKIKEVMNRHYKDMPDIAITSRPMQVRDESFWQRFHIDQPILDYYNATAFKQFWTYPDQKLPYYTKGLGYAYRIWDKYQLYFPSGAYKFKFLSGLDELCVLGYLQLRYNSDLCIITKSMKDVMCLRSFGYEAVSPRSENIMLPPECIAKLKRSYKRILVLFDNDMKHNGALYEFDKIYVPRITEKDKDVSDFCDNHGYNECSQMLYTITQAA